jgi:hypothetical protein
MTWNLALAVRTTLSFHSMTFELRARQFFPFVLALTGCMPGHQAQVETRPLPPLPDPITRHQSRIYIELPETTTEDSQCLAYEGYQTLCFVGVRAALQDSIKNLIWPGFRDVKIRRFGDELEEGDYLLQVELNLDALPPDASRHGWSAAAKGRWRVVRDGLPVEGQTLSTRSRGDFAYGSGLGTAAGEVVDAVAAHIAQVVVRLPVAEPSPQVLLPPVVAKDSFEPSADERKSLRVAADKASSQAKGPSQDSPDKAAKAKKAPDSSKK